MSEIAEEAAREFSVLWKFYEDTFAENIDRYAQRQLRLRLPFLPPAVFGSLLDKLIQTVRSEPLIVRESGDYIVIGDLRGSILDFLRVLRRFGSPRVQKYLFLGNYSNGGELSVQVITLVFLLKVLFPTNVVVLRGCFEFDETCTGGTLRSEIDMLYGETNVYSKVIAAFNWLPLAMIMNEKAFCVNGGIGRETAKLELLEETERPIEGFKQQNVVEIMWSSPTDLLPMFLPSSQSYGVLFGPQAVTQFLRATNLDILIRGNGVSETGYESQFNGVVQTVFTASMIEGSNGSAVLECRNGVINPVCMPCVMPMKRNGVTFVTSAKDDMFEVEQVEGLATPYRVSSQMALPQCNGLMVSYAKIGKAKDTKDLRKPTVAEVRKKAMPLRRKGATVVVPRIQKMTLDL